MVNPIRIIPRLEIKGPNLVKGIRLEGLRVLGQPDEFARYYYDNGADELLFIDIVASLYDRNNLHEIIKTSAKNIFIPITVGGGIRCINDIKELLRAGADKVCINTAAVRKPNLIREAVQLFGSSTIVVGIEAIKHKDSKYYAYTDNGRNYTGLEVVSWAKRMENEGCGEILLTSVDREGTGKGLDMELIQSVTSSVSIPLIACGGTKSKEDILNASLTGIHGLALSSIIHYYYINEVQDYIDQSSMEGNTEFLKTKRNYNNFEITSLNEIKEFLSINNIIVRKI